VKTAPAFSDTQPQRQTLIALKQTEFSAIVGHSTMMLMIYVYVRKSVSTTSTKTIVTAECLLPAGPCLIPYPDPDLSDVPHLPSTTPTRQPP